VSAAALAFGAIAPIGAASAAPTDDSEALGQVLASELLNIDLLEAASTSSGNPSDPGPNSEPLNLELLPAATVF